MKPNWENRTLFHGDNLDFMRAMNSETVDLIATDPPFNKSRTFNATPGGLAHGAKFQDRWRWKEDVHTEWIDQIKDDHPAVWEAIDAANAIYGKRNNKTRRLSREELGSDMGAFLCFMAVRLLEMRRLLKPTGSIYLHCDPTASHYLKMLMDAIFGVSNFRNEVVWRRTGAHGNPKRWGPTHDIILFYTKGRDYVWNWPKQPYMREHVEKYFLEDESGYFTNYYGNVLTGSGIRNGISGQAWRGFDPTVKNRHWAIPRKLWEESGLKDNGRMTQHDKLDALYAAGFIYIEEGKAWPVYQRRIRPDDGPAISDIWSYQPYTEGTVFGTEKGIDDQVSWIKPTASEKTGFPTQKPCSLYGRIIAASSNEGDMVFDPFAGCTTTLIAAERLRRKWVGIDLWDGAEKVVNDRMAKEHLALPKAERKDLFVEEVTFRTDLPVKEDDEEEVAPHLPSINRRIHELKSWQKLSHKQIVEELEEAQSNAEGLIICAGCGRALEAPFMELDHIMPKSGHGVNDISNRILLCRPCNGRKSNILTMEGLYKENKKVVYKNGKKTRWMYNEALAKKARHLAADRYKELRDA